MSTFPYIAVQGAVAQTFLQLRKGFPSKVDAGYLKRLRIAPANESYIISILRFLGLIDEDGQQQEAATDFFFRDDEAFKAGLFAMRTRSSSTTLATRPSRPIGKP